MVTAQSGSGYYQQGGSGYWANADTISAAIEIDFTNAAGNTISYDFSTNNAGKFMGVVLSDTTIVPELSSMSLAGLGACGLLLPRRRK